MSTLYVHFKQDYMNKYSYDLSNISSQFWVNNDRRTFLTEAAVSPTMLSVISIYAAKNYCVASWMLIKNKFH